MSLNKVILLGYVGKEPEVKYLDTGVCIADVRLATSERGYTLPNGTQVPERTDWHNIHFWNKQAEYVEKYLHTGDLLLVEGKLQYNKWVDKKGINRTEPVIIAYSLEIVMSAQARKQANSSAQATQEQPQQAASAKASSSTTQENKDELPF